MIMFVLAIEFFFAQVTVNTLKFEKKNIDKSGNLRMWRDLVWALKFEKKREKNIDMSGIL